MSKLDDLTRQETELVSVCEHRATTLRNELTQWILDWYEHDINTAVVSQRDRSAKNKDRLPQMKEEMRAMLAAQGPIWKAALHGTTLWPHATNGDPFVLPVPGPPTNTLPITLREALGRTPDKPILDFLEKYGYSSPGRLEPLLRPDLVGLLRSYVDDTTKLQELREQIKSLAATIAFDEIANAWKNL